MRAAHVCHSGGGLQHSLPGRPPQHQVQRRVRNASRGSSGGSAARPYSTSRAQAAHELRSATGVPDTGWARRRRSFALTALLGGLTQLRGISLDLINRQARCRALEGHGSRPAAARPHRRSTTWTQSSRRRPSCACPSVRSPPCPRSRAEWRMSVRSYVRGDRQHGRVRRLARGLDPPEPDGRLRVGRAQPPLRAGHGTWCAAAAHA
jgi:hypothetical protein